MQELPTLGERLDGDLLSPAPASYRRDWGNGIERRPAAVVRAASVDDVRRTIGWAGERGLRVVARGHGCSSGGQSLSDRLLLDTTALDDCAIGETSVAAGAGCRWGALQEALVARGRSCPVLVNNAAATVGGTLSAGGFGTTSVRRGAQVENVLELDVVTGAGELLRCDEASHPELFRHALCGLGQIGFIVRARLRHAAYLRRTLIEHRWFPASEPLAAIADTLEAEPGWEHCQLIYLIRERAWKLVLGRDLDDGEEVGDAPGVVVEHYHRGIFEREAAFVGEYAEAHVEEGREVDTGRVSKVWSDFLVPVAEASAFFEELRPLFDDPRMLWGFYGTLLCRGEGRPGLPLLPVPPAERVASFGPYCVVPSSCLEDYQRRFDRAAELCLRRGGRVYLHGHLPRVAGFGRRQFGRRAMAGWGRAKERYDPADVVGNGTIAAMISPAPDGGAG